MATERCGAHYARHPDKPHLCAVCTLPPGHDGDHDNLLPKPPYSVLRNAALAAPPGPAAPGGHGEGRA